MMGWRVNSDEQGWRKGPWTPEEDKLLSEYVNLHGEGRWSSVARCAGLNRIGKSCRLRWVNYLRPGLKRGHITPQEEGIIIELHALWGNKWSTIARYLPGRTDNEIKNYWRTHFKKKGQDSAKKDKKKIPRQRNQLQRNSTNKFSPQAEVIMKSDDNNTFSYHQDPVMGFPPVTDMSYSWTDNFPMDWLWGGLWNLDDHSPSTVNCSYPTDYAVN